MSYRSSHVFVLNLLNKFRKRLNVRLLSFLHNQFHKFNNTGA